MKPTYITRHLAEQDDPEKREKRRLSLIRARRQRARRERAAKAQQ